MLIETLGFRVGIKGLKFEVCDFVLVLILRTGTEKHQEQLTMMSATSAPAASNSPSA